MTEKKWKITDDLIARQNVKLEKNLEREYRNLAASLSKRGVNIDGIMERVRSLGVAIPSWGMTTGGTRFGRFPMSGEPRDVFEKLDDAATANQLTRANSKVSLHIPWDKTSDYKALKAHARRLGLEFDAMNSNTFEDQPGQNLSYKFGGLSHTKQEVRDLAVAHHLEVIEIGKKVGSKAINVWIADGTNFPGQASLSDSFNRYLASLKRIYKYLPKDWTMYIEYKPFEPAFYYTVLADWGGALMASSEVGSRCKVLVDLGHHLPGTNVEMIVARLIQAGKLGGFHFNDNKYADDDLTSGSIDPYRLFRVFHELVLAQNKIGKSFKLSYMIDQSHNLKDPIEALLQTTMELSAVYTKALLVDQDALLSYQENNDTIMAEMEIKRAFNTDVQPITAMDRKLRGGAIDPIGTFRQSGYRSRKAKEREND